MNGRILFNGNGGTELLERAAPWLRGSAHGRQPVVVLVTAAWGAGEYGEGPIRQTLRALGLDGPVENLCAWHVWRAFLERRPDVARVHADVESAREQIRAFYVQRTNFEAELVREGVRLARARFPGFSLGTLHGREPVRPDAVRTGAELLAEALGRELVASIEALVQNDERMLSALTGAEAQLLARTGLRLDPGWKAERERLEARILAADALIFFGGSPTKLLEPLRFFDLGPALLETLRRGATVVATSAGALVLCERMIVFDDRNPDPIHRHFQLLDRGLGLVAGLQILPHCMDRIHTDDPDNLAYLARRFGDRLCVGLNEESYLLVELAAQRAVSAGRLDGAYVFGRDGVKTRYGHGERIPLA